MRKVKEPDPDPIHLTNGSGSATLTLTNDPLKGGKSVELAVENTGAA